jgi:UDP-GlcNAc:undecaprenyl-phosphate/decaprenyl-phosphate GlcNAc-1-phosphate transferase
MRSYVFLFLISLITTLLLTPLAGRLAIALGAVDLPDNKRRIHTKATPRMGGVAIFAAFLLTLAIVPFLRNELATRFNEHPQWYVSILAATTIIFLLGVYDDLRGANAPLKIAVQILAALVLQYSGFGIELLSIPFFGENHALPLWLSFSLTAGWIVGITNAFNLVDGIDGLASGISAFALLSILISSVALGSFEVGLLAVILLGSVIGFLYYNFHPASIFLGDSGSLTLGFLVATLSMLGSQKGTTTLAIAIPLVSFGLPVVEIFLSLIRRFVGGKPLMQSDRGHIHHRLLEHGLSVRQVAILLYGVCGVFCLFGILLLSPQRSFASLIYSVLGVLVIIGVQRLRYPEFEEIGNKIRQGVARRRREMVANISLRQLSTEFKRTKTPEHFFAVLREFSEHYSLDGIQLEIRHQLNQETKSLVKSSAEKNGWYEAHANNCGISLALTPGISNLSDLVASDRVWSLRLPLENGAEIIGAMTLYRNISDKNVTLDLQTVCGDFQRELSLALDTLMIRSVSAETLMTNHSESFAG